MVTDTKKHIYIGGHGVTWSMDDVIESETFKQICRAKEVVLKRAFYGLDDGKPTKGPEARHAALAELLRYGSLGVGKVTMRGDTAHVEFNFNYVG